MNRRSFSPFFYFFIFYFYVPVYLVRACGTSYGMYGIPCAVGTISSERDAQGGSAVPAVESSSPRGAASSHVVHTLQGRVLGGAAPRLLRVHTRVARQRGQVPPGSVLVWLYHTAGCPV